MAAARIYQRQWVLIRLPVALAALALMVWLWRTWLPMPPTELTFSAGRPDGAYYPHAQRFAKYFAERGVELKVLASDGSEQNLQRLRGQAAPQAQLAYLQGGTAATDAAPEGSARVHTLARVDMEPVWIFSRLAGVDSLLQLQGLRVSLGAPGSGTRKLAVRLLEQVRLAPADVVDSGLAGMQAVEAMRQGRLDAVIQVASADAASVKALLQTPGIHLVQLSRSAALIERLPFLQLRLLPQGAIDGKYPQRDTSMLVTTSSLVARDDLHPALQRLAVAAAREIHGAAGLFHRAGEFPTLKRIEYPSSREARETLTYGLPWLERQLPLPWAQLLLRLLVICLPIALVAGWFAHVLPAYLRWVLESRVSRWYGELKYIELDLQREDFSGIDLTKYLNRLGDMEQRMGEFVTPDYLMARWFTLRKHVDFVRLRLLRLRGR